MRFKFLFLLLSCTLLTQAQETRTKKLAVQDTIILDSISINPFKFKVTRTDGTVLDSTAYAMDFGKSTFMLLEMNTETLSQKGTPLDSLIFNYRVYPEFLTKKYSKLDPSIIVDNTNNLGRLISLNENRQQRDRIPFDGLNTSGSIVRGVSAGNNQNSTVNSELDLQISGRLSDKVSLRASIQDANIPNQSGGYSQNLDEFDQIFIELYSDNWNIRAGDINLVDDTSYFNPFTKKIQGLSVQATLNHSETSHTDIFGAGALVRGVFANSQFTGQEGNQGPYKIIGPSGELFVLIVSGSETVYVNGIALERGENADYVIDYNAGELRFNPTFPITSEMRIQIDYQFTEQNYTRFVGYGGARFRQSEHLSIGTYLYSESDAKNQELQQSLTQEQKQRLALAGDDMDAMVSPSAIPDTFDENKILYRQIVINGQEVFEFSTDPEETLFNVRFTEVGPNQGDYILSTINTLQRTFQYIPPIDGVSQGNFAPVVQLAAPTLLQVGGIRAAYTPSESTRFKAELSGSRNDLNLFSDLDDSDNTGIAAHLEGTHRLLGTDSTAQLTTFVNWDYLQRTFNNVQRLYRAEFNRDWSLSQELASTSGLLDGNQNLVATGLTYTAPQKGQLTYTYEHLEYQDIYSGNRHSVQGRFFSPLSRKPRNTTSSLTSQDSSKTSSLRAALIASTLQANDVIATANFSRIHSSAALGYKKGWVGAKFFGEDTKRRIKANDSLTPLSQRFVSYEATIGVGDSTNVYVEAGYRYRTNDSLRNNQVKRVNTANTYFIKSQLLTAETSQLGVFINYRTLDYEQEGQEQETSLNARIQYDQQFAQNGIRWNTLYETNSGTQPQQEFSYVAVDEGQGTHTWNDYNGDGVQQLEEFELAQFQDEADFIRILLPNQVFIKTHQNRLSQQLIVNPQAWSGQRGLKKLLSHFYNQTSYILDRKELRSGSDFNLNPFASSDNEIGLNASFRNTLFFNRGKRKYTTSYSYVSSQAKNLLSTGLQENTLQSHQLNFTHKLRESWLVDFITEIGQNTSTFENFTTRNFEVATWSLAPKLSYLFGPQNRVALEYRFSNKENQIANFETLDQHNLGVSFAVASGGKGSLTGGFNYIENRFGESATTTTSAFSPVAYQMLEGLQPGTNFTWNLIAQKRLTKYLDLNVSYFGRKSDRSKTIHTGNVQLRAFF